MKKIIYFISLVLVITSISSCQEDLDNWYSETASFDGRFSVATSCEEYSSDDTSIEDGIELMFYNSAKNIQNDIWLDTEIAGIPIKSNFKVEGNSAAFSSDETTQNIASDAYYIFTPSGGMAAFNLTNANGYYGIPKSAGLAIEGVLLYSRVKLEEGKILPDAATSIGGNTADSVFVKVVLHSDFVEYESYQTPATDWKVPGVPEFSWRISVGSNTPATSDWDEHWTLDGYRYTGMPEDN